MKKTKNLYISEMQQVALKCFKVWVFIKKLLKF